MALTACQPKAPVADTTLAAADPVTSSDAKSHKDPAAIWPKLKLPRQGNVEEEAKIAKLLAGMTLEQKIAQMIQPEIRDITVDDMRKYGFGSYLNGGGSFPAGNKHATPADWIKLAEDMYQASIDASEDGSTIPTMWGTDAVHGHNNVIGATLFPHNIGLGAANNPDLIEQIAKATAREVMVTGIDWVFAPTVAVVRDDRWGRTYEGYSEDPTIVRNYAAAIVKGLQGAPDADFLGDERVISTVKHFLGDGGTERGIDQGDNIASEQQLFDIHAQGYIGGLQAGAQTVMASFNSWHGEKIHGNKYLLTDVLKTRMGFDGLVVGDWNGHGQVKDCSNENCPAAANAGLDVYMVPTAAWKPLYENLIAQVKSGVIAQSRIDDAVTRILRVKVRAGLFEKPSPAARPLSGKTDIIGSAEHRAVAAAAVQQSLVLLKNQQGLLPLNPMQKVLVTGQGADNIGMQSGGWTITWQGTGNNNADFPGGSSIYAGIHSQVSAAGGQVQLSSDGSYQQKPDVAIVVFGEQPYAEGNGDIDNLEYQRGNKADLALLKKLQADGIKVVSLFISGRPLWVNAELNASDAFVAIWLPGSEGHAIAPVLFTDKDGKVQQDFRGKLSFSWPNSPSQTTVNQGDDNYQPLFAYGYGLTYTNTPEQAASLFGAPLTESSSADNALTALPLFDRDIKAPWQFVLQSAEQSAAVSSNQQQLGAVKLQSFDRKVQEDARL
ncbi:MAG: glycoside hydrolase family 3 C-terminal domain-containing protein, partial [Gammaproteobacteria bacterium]|nr:glycoside hydrolase family 3 C-terminal domain-containing protein [Gammaproteobacteria bacterium]